MLNSRSMFSSDVNLLLSSCLCFSYNVLLLILLAFQFLKVFYVYCVGFDLTVLHEWCIVSLQLH